MSRSRFIAASLSTATLVAGAVVGLDVTRAAAATAVSVWETTADHTRLLAPQTGATFTSGTGSASQTITVDPATTYQPMTGFGASFTDSSAWLVANSPQRAAIMAKLFDPSQGIGLDFLRQPIGASDFSRSLFSYDDMPSGQSDPTLANFSIAHDNAYILPVLQQARQINPALTVMATPWSPPGWMKSSGSMIGGSLLASDYQAFANYLVKFTQAYQAAGVPVSLITPQNEPEYSPSNYPGSTLAAGDETNLISGYLGPALSSAGSSTKIIGYDHNWNDTSFPEAILGNTGAAQYTAGTAWHCYAGSPSAQSTVHNAYPGKDTYFTECSGTQSSNTADTFSDSLDWQTENLIIGATRNWAKSVVTWNMALDPSGGPSMNCTTCTGVVTVDNTAGTATYNAEYYVLGHASKFVKPGAVRIDSNTYGPGNVEDVAFQNPDGSTALIVLNSDTSNAHTFAVAQNGQSFTYTLPAKAVATFTWPGAGGPSPSPSPSASASASASASSSPSPSPTTTGTGGIDPTKWYEVVNTNSGLCVDAAGWGTSNGTAVQQWACGNGQQNQEWQFQPTGNGYAQVVNRNAPALVWDVTGGPGATSNGVPIQLWTAGGGTNQQWTAASLGNGAYSFTARNSGTECLDVTNRSTSNGTQLQQWACTGGDTAQSFRLVQEP